MNTELLKQNYEQILSSIASTDFITGDDLYSGVFLSVPFKEYWRSDKKVMIVGRETAGWNTKNGKNTISRIVECGRYGDLSGVVSESFERYAWHPLDKKGGDLRKTSKSWFQRFYDGVASRLGLSPYELLYQNLYAWDYNGKSPVSRPSSEFEIIQSLSVQLLAESIRHCNPDFIIFAVGCSAKNDATIKKLMNCFGGYETQELIPKQFWKFKFNNTMCIRIAHPRSQKENHRKFREKAVQSLIS
ncbi:hypothetical protein [Photobacterium leiognathi]|uniref:hypothetical protein n=1 Tax=Photobacterium leiognathi TaxID=553611 RepID=UPI0029811154|nr:hypothetical protein [Photobacterium leiognathi]